MLSLLHALGDREEFIRETFRLIEESDMDEATWRLVWNMGRDVAPDFPLFGFGKTLGDVRGEVAGLPANSSRRNTFDRRMVDTRAEQRRIVSDRRLEERRTTNLPWLRGERRNHERRCSNPDKKPV